MSKINSSNNTNYVTNKVIKTKHKERDINGFSKCSDTILSIIIGIFTAACVFPFIFLVIISFTDEKSLAYNGYKLIPEKWSVFAYKYVLSAGSALIHSYGITIFVTLVGTIIALIIMSLYAYAISRKNFRYRKFFNFFAFFTTLFSGGLVPTYIVVTQLLHLRNNIWALIIPLCCSAWYILILKTFFRTSVPDAIVESAKIDGASEIRTFIQIVLPVSLPGIATIALFTTLGYWNDWYSALLYIDKDNLIPLQYMLMKLQNSMDFLANNLTATNSIDAANAVAQMPRETARMAMVVLATGPIVLAYPFFQRFFVKGLTVGAVKE